MKKNTAHVRPPKRVSDRPEYGTELEYMRSYVRTLRKKIEDDTTCPKYILTEPWVGYRFCNPSVPDSPSTGNESL
jgi:DNA-binding response OmpR family regulator